MSTSKNKTQRLINWLSDTIINELTKPEDEIDVEFVDSCENLLDILMGEQRLSEKEIKTLLNEIYEKNGKTHNIPVKRKTKTFFISLVAAVVLLLSCVTMYAFTPIGDYIKKTVMFAESTTTLSMKVLLDVTEYEGVTYGFEEKINIDDRYNFIIETDKIVKRLDIEKQLNVNVYTEETYNNSYISNGILNTFYQNLPSLDHIVNIIFATYGDYCNYGMVYGYANYIYDDIYGIEQSYPEPVISADNIFLALNYLCFHTDFASAEEIALNQKIANDFVADYISKHGENAFVEILKNSGSIEKRDTANAALSEYYAEKGVNVKLTRNLYKDGGQANQYIVLSEYATFEIPENWVDGMFFTAEKYHGGEYKNLYDGFLNSDYEQTERFFDVNVDQIRQYRELFKLEYYTKNVVFTFVSAKHSMDGSRNLDGPYIEVKSLHMMMYYYIDTIMCTSDSQKWKVEGFPAYYAYRFDEYGNAQLEQDWFSGELGKLFIEKTDRPVDFAKDIYTIHDMSAYRYYRRWGYVMPNMKEWTAVSFINYLVNNYDEEKVIEYITVNNNLKVFTDKKFPELVEDWIDYLEEKCAVYFEE